VSARAGHTGACGYTRERVDAPSKSDPVEGPRGKGAFAGPPRRLNAGPARPRHELTGPVVSSDGSWSGSSIMQGHPAAVKLSPRSCLKFSLDSAGTRWQMVAAQIRPEGGVRKGHSQALIGQKVGTVEKWQLRAVPRVDWGPETGRLEAVRPLVLPCRGKRGIPGPVLRLPYCAPPSRRRQLRHEAYNRNVCGQT